jgi:glycine/D-amino acid oxidase-like deaminating enzyme
VRAAGLGSVDAVVVGGGVVGTAIAYALTRRRLGRVALLERGILAGGTTSHGMGNLIGVRHAGLEADLVRLSMRWYAELPEDLRETMGYRQAGSLAVVPDEALLGRAAALVTEQRSRSVELLDASAARPAAPYLAPSMAGAIACTDDARVDPAAAARGFARAAVAAGAAVYEQAEVTAIEVDRAGRIQSVATTRGALATHVAIDAAGIWAPNIAALVGERLPIAPVRGVVLATEGSQDWGGRPTVLEFGAPGGTGTPGQPAVATVLYPATLARVLLVGSSREPAADRIASPDVVGRLALRAVALVPELATRHVARVWAGLRPTTPDGLPIVAEIPNVHRFIVAAGHWGDGVTLAPLTGELVADIVSGQPSPIDRAVLSHDRFGMYGSPQTRDARSAPISPTQGARS